MPSPDWGRSGGSGNRNEITTLPQRLAQLGATGSHRYTTVTGGVAYDRNGNLTQRLEDGEEQRNQGTDTCAATQLAAPVTRMLTYDKTDQLLTDQLPDTKVSVLY
ncbi:MAG TPA: hypothetical protein VFN74_08910 [Chloroflexota bacterium]|nr:hypothetical protein [Chloroflexota bacterium]